MNCCAECFGDRVLRRNIIPTRSTEQGQCPCCGTDDVDLIDSGELVEYFEALAGAYRQNSAGKLLIQWFREDWGMFQHPRMDDPRAKDLLAEILNDSEIVQQQFVPASDPSVDRLREWEKLRDELMYHNRYFPQTTIDLSRLESLLAHLTLEADEVPTLRYRARLQTGDTPYPASEMGAPPSRIAAHGRANPAGIPYLYLGSNPLVAISEIRLHTGEWACVADFTTPADLQITDLRNPQKMVSPFLPLLEDGNEIDIGNIRDDLPFLKRLGDELTRPIIPQAAAIDYTPSQYLCEFIKKCGYQGVIYRSSVSDGINLALFDPDRAQCANVQQHRVTRVCVDITAGI